MGSTFLTRMGDGAAVEMTRDEIRAEIEDGAEQGARRAKAGAPGSDEIGHLVDIFASSARMTGVPVGDEIVLSCDGTMDLRWGKNERFCIRRQSAAETVALSVAANGVRGFAALRPRLEPPPVSPSRPGATG